MKLTPTESHNLKLSRLGVDTFDKAIEDRDFNTARAQYRALLEIATVSHDAITSLRQSRALNLSAAADSPDPDDFPTFTMTSGGRLWINARPIVRRGRTFANACGWVEIDKSGKPIAEPIGHLAFRKFKLAKKNLNRKANDWFKVCRPDGPWRRHIDCVLEHPQFGNGKVLATDGLHAIFEFDVVLDAEAGTTTKRRAEVSFHSLHEVGYRTAHNSKSGKPVTKSEKVKSPKMTAMALDLL